MTIVLLVDQFEGLVINGSFIFVVLTRTDADGSTKFGLFHYSWWVAVIYEIVFIFALLLTLRGGNFWAMFKPSSWKTSSTSTEDMVTETTVTISSSGSGSSSSSSSSSSASSSFSSSSSSSVSSRN